MRTTTLLNAVTNTVASAANGIHDVNDTSPYIVWQIGITVTGSVNLEGSLDGVTWNLLPLPTGAASAAVTASGMAVTYKAPYVRANPTANGGAITAKISF